MTARDRGARMTALVTGVAGFIGSHLGERLIEDGVAVRGIDRLSDYYDPALKRANLAALQAESGFELLEGAINDLPLEDALEGVDVVYHLAGQAGVRASWGEEFGIYLDDNVLSTQRLLEATRKSAVRGFVLASSSSIYGDAEHFPTAETELPKPVSPYGATKLAAEHLGRLYWSAFEVPVVAVRYFTIFGPRQRPDMAFSRFIRASLEGRPIQVLGDGKQERDFTYVGDAVDATIAAASRGEPGSVYNVAGGNHSTVAGVIEILEGLVGHSIAVDHAPAALGDARRTGADTSRARKELGFAPKVSLEDGIRLQMETERNTPGPDAVS